MLRPGVLVAALLLATGTPAAADYVFDPKDLPAGFTCEADRSAEDCAEDKRIEAWSEAYGDRSDYWFETLLFDVNFYFAERAPWTRVTTAEDVSAELTDRLGYATPNLVDVVYSIALRRDSEWAFAIDRNAQMRLVRQREKDEIDPTDAARFARWLPTSMAEAAEAIAALYVFEETDLTRCKGALAHLRAFPMQRNAPFWSERELDWVAGKGEAESNAIIVTADGDGVFLRARGVPDRGRPVMRLGEGPVVIYDQRNGGEGYEWAKAMEKAARPCLKPSTATPPWEKLVAAERAQAAKGN